MTAVNILVFAGILIALVVLHELGHMVVAKLCGLRVERFSVFFGRPIWSFRRGETEYGVGWLPLGGYVKITGMTRDELVHRQYDPVTGAVVREWQEPPEVQERAYCNATTPRKIATIVAGPGANVVVAVIAFAISFWIGIPQFGNSNVVSAVTKGSPAQAADLRPGDRILSINGVGAVGGDPTPMRGELQKNPGKSVVLVIARDGGTVRITTPPLAADPSDPRIGRLGFQFGDRRVGELRFGFAGGLREAVDYTGFLTKEQIKALGRLFVDEKTRSEVSSVVGIGATYNDIAGSGAGTVFRFVGILSLILAIMNLLPLLPLDGGHIVFALAERIRRRPLAVAAFQRASTIGIVLVAFFFLYALNNDIFRLTGQGFRP